MNLRETLGFLLVVAGLTLLPTAWAFSRKLWLVAFLLLVVGMVLFYTERMLKRDKASRREEPGGGCGGSAVPTDINNYTGWRSGGRSETMDNASDSGGGGDGD